MVLRKGEKLGRSLDAPRGWKKVDSKEFSLEKRTDEDLDRQKDEKTGRQMGGWKGQWMVDWKGRNLGKNLVVPLVWKMV
jgi:hypothetical protein